MRWYHDLTSAQRRILIALAACVILVIGLLGWSVWASLKESRSVSPSPAPLPTKTVAPTMTLTPASVLIPPTVATSTFELSQAGRIAFDIAEVRDTQAYWGTALTLVSQHGMSVQLYRRYTQDPPFQIREAPVLQALGLKRWEDEPVDPVAQARRTAAIYVPEVGDLYLQREWTGGNDTLLTQLAYAYARAFPEQSGQLAQLEGEATTVDHRLALAAVGDGDAMLSLWLYRGVEPGSAEAEGLVNTVAAAILPYWQTEVPLRHELSRLPLDLGASFAAARYADDGTQSLNQVILRPPRSTEQLLHPERYLANDDPAILTPLAPTLDKGWTLTLTETVGEALLGLSLREWSKGAVQPTQAQAWGGDLLQVWIGPDGAQVTALQTSWDTARDAGRIHALLTEMLPRPLLPGLILDTTPAAQLPRGRWWAGRQGAVFLYRRADRVLLVWGSRADAVESVAAALP